MMIYELILDCSGVLFELLPLVFYLNRMTWDYIPHSPFSHHLD